MPRQALKDEYWPKLKRSLLAESTYDKPDLRRTVEGMLYRRRVGCPWRDLPTAFGSWKTIYKRFRAWAASGKCWRVFKALVSDPDLEWAFMDGTYAKAHQHRAGAVGPDPQAIGPSRAGHTTKLHRMVDAYGLPIDFKITGGRVAECTLAPERIAQVADAEAIVGDKGYDSTTIRRQIEAQSSHPRQIEKALRGRDRHGLRAAMVAHVKRQQALGPDNISDKVIDDGPCQAPHTVSGCRRWAGGEGRALR